MNKATLRRRLADMEARATTLARKTNSNRPSVSLRAFEEYYCWSLDNPGKEYHDTALQQQVDGFFAKFDAGF